MVNEERIKQYMEIKLLRHEKWQCDICGLASRPCICKMQMHSTTDWKTIHSAISHTPISVLPSFRRAEQNQKNKRLTNSKLYCHLRPPWNGFASNEAYTRYLYCALYSHQACTNTITYSLYPRYWPVDNLARFAIPKRRHAAAVAAHTDIVKQ